jgi:hypothetical protein
LGACGGFVGVGEGVGVPDWVGAGLRWLGAGTVWLGVGDAGQGPAPTSKLVITVASSSRCTVQRPIVCAVETVAITWSGEGLFLSHVQGVVKTVVPGWSKTKVPLPAALKEPVVSWPMICTLFVWQRYLASMLPPNAEKASDGSKPLSE